MSKVVNYINWGSASALSAFSNGDICHISGKMYIYTSGANRATVTIDDSFSWSSTNIRIYTATWTPTSTTYHFTYSITLLSSSAYFEVTVEEDSYSYNGQLGLNNLKVYKSTNPWAKVSKAYKKVSGSWVEQSDLTTVFDPTKHYKKGD